jgi:uncharacterized membrane protein YfcA
VEYLNFSFPVSGIETLLWLPPLAAFLISFLTSMTGISGAVLLLPFQVSVLGFASPAASSTNLVYNLVAIPGGAYRYWKEGRLLWSLSLTILTGALPGTLAGWHLRLQHLSNPESFRVFAGAVMLFIAGQVFYSLRHGHIFHPGDDDRALDRPVARISLSRIEYRVANRQWGFNLPAMVLLSFGVGLLGGAYGIGGGAIIAPFCIALFRLPVHYVAGAALFSTLVTSLFAVLLYATGPVPPGVAARPDWLLGILFGLGGFAGIYAGARLQHRLPENWLKLGLGLLLTLLGLSWLWSG